jgi:acyl dehydratase
MTAQLFAKRHFSQSDLVRFADLSGDHNPIHVDSVAARRCVFGEVVVHGMYLVLWGLNELTERRGIRCLETIRASFHAPVLPDEAVELTANEVDNDQVLQISGKDGPRVTMWLRARVSDSVPPLRVPTDRTRSSPTPRPNTFEDIRSARGQLPLWLNELTFAAEFPALARTFDPWCNATLLGLTRLIGMECPGLHSLFSQFELRRSSDPVTAHLAFRVERARSIRAPIRIRVACGDFRGTAQALYRPPPVEQLSFAAVRKLVKPAAFIGQTALIVGGSRGLGEITAKIIAAGGGTALITYAVGIKDAHRVVEEIACDGGHSATMALDVLSAAPDRIVFPDGLHPTHLYYFATPRISRLGAEYAQAALLGRFIDYYVAGFHMACKLLLRTPGDVLRAFYPSSVFIDTLPAKMQNYVIAKAAGEALCRILNRHGNRLHIMVSRLPPLRTDQCQALMDQQATKDPTEIMIGIVDRLHTFQKGSND